MDKRYSSEPPSYEQHTQSSSYQLTTPAPQSRGPSPSSEQSSSSSGFSKFIKGLTGESLPDLLNPPPPSFLRPPQPNYPYTPFTRCVAITTGNTLEKGFLTVPPATDTQPHPFMTHDVNEDDWTRFLDDLQKMGKLSPMNHVVAGVAPLAVGGIGAFFMTRAIENRMRRKKSGPVTQLVDHWNHYFFWPRMMDVSLVHGRIIYSGQGDVPHEMQGYTRDEEYDSDDPNPHGHAQSGYGGGFRARREGRIGGGRLAERREARMDRRQGRLDNRRNERDAKDEPWKLVITYRPCT